MDFLTTIIHEVGHYLSDVYSKGDSAPTFFEEGMADVWAEECVNHYLKNGPKEDLEKLHISSKLIPYISFDEYSQPANFATNTLDILRQSAGTSKEAEFEYFLGDKSKFFGLIGWRQRRQTIKEI